MGLAIPSSGSEAQVLGVPLSTKCSALKSEYRAGCGIPAQHASTGQ